MQDLARFVLAGLEHNRIQAASNPSNCDKLLGRIAAAIKVIGLPEQLSCFLKPGPRRGFALNRPLFFGSKLKRIMVLQLYHFTGAARINRRSFAGRFHRE